ncbi:MAG TPA: hypothetical protein VKV39_02860 [Candidatus Sulfotelmatobacter sp.]|nr:hypothetical protein [Candidatus Sulfotelmatobacter sp.]
MNIATDRSTLDPQQPRDKKIETIALSLLILAFVIVWAATRAHFMADTVVYADAILRHQHARDPADYRQLTSNPFWDFGHILWRPFGWLCFVVTKPITQMLVGSSERGQALLALIGINFVAALACVWFFFLLAMRIVGHIWPAATATFGLLSADAFLNYSHSGNAYVVGLACLITGMYFSFGRNSRASSLVSTIIAAFTLAFAVLFWFPYIFVLPAAIATPLFVNGFEPQPRRRALQLTAACAAIGLAVYMSVIATIGLWHFTDLKEWVMASGHGQIQAGGFRVLARLAFSMPRSFLNMGRDGMWLKRYLVSDPYAPVTVGALFRLSLWKLVLFYVSAFVIGVEMSRSKRGRMFLLLSVLATAPILVFSVFVFEAGSIERYLPLYPFVFLALGCVLANERTASAAKVLLVLVLITMTAINVKSASKRALELRKADVLVRIADLIPILDQNSLVLAINEQDNLAEFRQNFPLDPMNLHAAWQTYDMLEINAARLQTWREDFATRTLATWQRGGTVWLPERVFRSRPLPEWNWVEGDDKRVRWADLPSFFSHFETGSVVGGEDGFVSLKPSSRNKEILNATIQRNGEGR